MKGVRRTLRVGGVGRNVDEELGYHFERTIEELMARGASRTDAEAEARRRFGDVVHYRAELEAIDGRTVRRRRWSEQLDAARVSLRYALRSIMRSPGLAFGVILAFALGIGANLTMYGIVDRLLLRAPDHIVDADGIRRIHVNEFVSFMRERFTGASMSYPDFRALRGVSAFEDVAAVAQRTVTVGSGVDAAEKQGVYVSGNYFRLLGTAPAVGRFFTEEEDRIGGPAQVVLSWSAWQRDHAGSDGALGRTIDFGYGPFEIIGVAPRNFTGVDLAPVDYWLPFHASFGRMRGSSEWLDDHGTQFFVAVARLRAGVPEEAAAAQATAAWIAGREGTEFASEESDPRVLLTSVLSARGPDAPPEAMVARLLLMVAAVVLLIAAMNIANLLLARSLKQRRETAVRLALGISRRRLIGQIMLEGMLLAAAGGVVAVVLALWARDMVGGLLLPDVMWSDGLDIRIIGVAAALTLLAGGAAALVPAIQSVRGTLGDTLRQAGAGATSLRTTRVRTTLALVQTALSVLLLVGAGLFIRSLDRVRSVDYGFDARNVVYATPTIVAGGMSEDEITRLAREGERALLRVPGVRAVGSAHSLPFHSYRTTRLRAESVDSIPVPESGGPYVLEISAGYLDAMGIAITAGRGFTEHDAGTSEPVSIINESMAAALWPGRSALGRCLYVGRPSEGGSQTRCSRVVGVAEDTHRSEVQSVTTLQYYIPMAQQQLGGTPRVFVINVAEPTAETLDAIRRTILAADARIRYVDAETLMNRIDPQTRSWRLGAAVFSIFGILALIVASIGLYSVLAFDVAQRTREIGVRSALGASRPAVIRLVVGNALRITAAGVLVGVLGALVLAGRVEPLLFEIPPRDPVTFAGVVVMLHLVAALASSLPAWRAARVDPNVALRAD